MISCYGMTEWKGGEGFAKVGMGGYLDLLSSLRILNS